MDCGINDLKSKEVIDIQTGERLGFPYDVEVDVNDGRLLKLILPGSYKFLGLIGKGNDLYIKWENIVKIGSDIILVKVR